MLDDNQEIHNLGHVVLVSNMPYIGFHYQVGTVASFKDGLLDVLFFADLDRFLFSGNPNPASSIRWGKSPPRSAE